MFRVSVWSAEMPITRFVTPIVGNGQIQQWRSAKDEVVYQLAFLLMDVTGYFEDQIGKLALL